MANRKNYLVATILLAVFTVNFSIAQISKTPKIAEKIKQIGTELSWETIGATMKLYQPLHQADSNNDMVVSLNQSYGSHKLHKLDVYAPKNAKDLPVLIFTHGGGYVAGDKNNATNIGRWAARNGMIGVTINYRLAPEVQWPQSAEDLALAIKWVKSNIASHGGDTSKIILGGESAGAMHTSEYVFREELQIENDGVIGAIIISPPSVDQTVKGCLDPDRDLKYFGKNGDRYEQSIVNFVEGRKIPLLIAYSEFEPNYILDQTLRLVEAVAKRDAIKGVRKLPLVVSAPGHNHISISMHIGTIDKTLGPDILEFILSLTN